MAGWSSRETPPSQIDGVPVSCYRARQFAPGLGLSGLYSPAMTKAVRQRVKSSDVIHVHGGRDLCTLGVLNAAKDCGIAQVSQTHGMVGVDSRYRARAFDLLVGRRTFQRVSIRLALTEQEERDLGEVFGSETPILRVPNGVPIYSTDASFSEKLEVLFCARIHSRKRPMDFVDAAHLIADEFPEVRFSIVGPDDGELSRVLTRIRKQGRTERVVYEGALTYSEIPNRMRRAAVYVLPSVAEPFPMSLLEAMSSGIASVCTTETGVSRLLAEEGAALVVEPSVESIAGAVADLLRSPQLREATAAAGRKLVTDTFSMEAVAEQLERIYEEAMNVSRTAQP